MDFFTSLRNYGPQALAHVSGSTYRTRRHDFLRISNDKWCFIFKIRLVFFFIFRNKNHYYKQDYQQYIVDVPDYIMERDADGFYSRLVFAYIGENVLAVEYKFAYTSSGGLAQRSFTIPMTEETIVELIKTLESKLTASAFAKEQRTLMTSKLRDFIKARDNYTCCFCGNSTYAEPNLLLEIDHIIPVSKGGLTVESNLQTLCWKCNRSKSDKIL